MSTQQFKVGDEVITDRFDGDFSGNPSFDELMYKFIGEKGVITYISKKGYYMVHGWNWPSSALTLVNKEEEFKQGEEVEVSDRLDRPFIRLSYIGEAKIGTYVCENEVGVLSSWRYCRRPAPKMQKWNVWQSPTGGKVVHPYGVVISGWTIFHTFELPENK